jgi:hypothetical protein
MSWLAWYFVIQNGLADQAGMTHIQPSTCATVCSGSVKTGFRRPRDYHRDWRADASATLKSI